jgi:ABC-2 type transport system permease protein
MRSLSDEFKAGTFEILKTKPLSSWQIVWGKYFSILIVLLLAILPTIIYVVTIKVLSTQGGIDSGGIMGSYIGLFFLVAVFAAIGLCCSGFTNNAVVAFLISAFSCLILYFGFSALSRLPFFTNGFDYYIEMLGIDFHYTSMSRGVLDSRDLVYFISLVFIFLLTTVKNLHKK